MFLNARQLLHLMRDARVSDATSFVYINIILFTCTPSTIVPYSSTTNFSPEFFRLFVDVVLIFRELLRSVYSSVVWWMVSTIADMLAYICWRMVYRMNMVTTQRTGKIDGIAGNRKLVNCIVYGAHETRKSSCHSF